MGENSGVILHAADALDHLLIGAPTLQEGIDWLEGKTGVRATLGGSHPGLGTWNALASLGENQYLEIIAPDPLQADVDTFYLPGLRDFRRPGVATWAARRKGLGAGLPEALPPEWSCGPLLQGSRLRPDGTRLAWALTFPEHAAHGNFEGALPFLIEWESFESHPGRTAPAGLRLRSLSIEAVASEALRRGLEALGIDGRVSQADATSIRVELDTPRGSVNI